MDFKNDNIWLMQGDCLERMKEIPEGSVDVVLTDPPYNYEFIGKDWDDQESSRRLDKIKDSTTLVKNIPYGSGLSGGVKNDMWYKRNKDNNKDYIDWSILWMRELFRVTKEGAFVAVFNNQKSIAYTQVALESAGFFTRDLLVYQRNSGIPKGFNLNNKLIKESMPTNEITEHLHSSLLNQWEGICVVQKPIQKNVYKNYLKNGTGLFYTKNGESFRSNILSGYKRETIDKVSGHTTPKCGKLINDLLMMLTHGNSNTTVLDCFMGGGSTLIEANKLGINSIGIERGHCEKKGHKYEGMEWTDVLVDQLGLTK